MTTLISFLGKAKTGYSPANYVFEPGFKRAVPYFGMALLDYLKPQKLILAGTSGSMWDVFFDHQHTDDDGLLALIEAVPKQVVTPQMLAIHEQRLTEKLGIPVQCLLIPYARNDAEQTAILTDLAGALGEGENIVLDVTHGFRHLPMLALVAARYLQRVRGVKVQEVYYGALEMTDAHTKETPVLRLAGMLQMLDWVEGLATYDNSGNYGVFAPLLQRDGMDEKCAALLAQGAFFERNSNPMQAKQALTGALNHVREHVGPLGNLFRDKLAEHIGWFRRGNRHDWELALADRYLSRQDYLRAVTYLYESFVSRAVWDERGDPSDYAHRESARKNAEKNGDLKLLTYLRNAMVHGVRTDDSFYDRKIKDEVQRLLQDQKALDARLYQLRKTLFKT